MIDFEVIACLNIIMPNTNTSGKSGLGSGLRSNSDMASNWNHKKGNIHFLLKKLKENRKKKVKEKFILSMSVIGLLVISGIIISF